MLRGSAAGVDVAAAFAGEPATEIDAGGAVVFVSENATVGANPGADATTAYVPACEFAMNRTDATPSRPVVRFTLVPSPSNVPLGPVAGAVNVTTTPLR